MIVARFIRRAPCDPRHRRWLGYISLDGRRLVETDESQRPEVVIEGPRGRLVAQPARDFLLFAAGAAASATAACVLLPDRTRRAWFPGLVASAIDTLAGARRVVGQESR